MSVLRTSSHPETGVLLKNKKHSMRRVTKIQWHTSRCPCGVFTQVRWCHFWHGKDNGNHKPGLTVFIFPTHLQRFWQTLTSSGNPFSFMNTLQFNSMLIESCFISFRCLFGRVSIFPLTKMLLRSFTPRIKSIITLWLLELFSIFSSMEFRDSLCL